MEMIKIAKHVSTGRMLHVDLAQNGLSCGCVCVGCGEVVQAVQPNKRESFYRHHNINCRGAQETALHKLGKQIIAEHNEMYLRPGYSIIYRDVVLESIIGDYRSDALISTDTGTYYVEVVVNHELSAEKEKYYRSIGKCVEIDLREFIGQQYTYDEIKDAVLSQTHNKRLIQAVPTTAQFDMWEYLKPLAVILVLILGIRALSRSR